ncbi:MAG: hypothetical protein V1835_05985 [Candidatus Micrarchaeota archaeon]
MQIRGQFAVEMFFAFTFAILLVFWLVNYIELFSESTERDVLITQQKMVAKELGIIINEICVSGNVAEVNGRGAAITINAPCLKYKQESYYYNISRARWMNFTVWSPATNFSVTRNTPCYLDLNVNLTRCSSFDKLCIFKINQTVPGMGGEIKNQVKIQSGACA